MTALALMIRFLLGLRRCSQPVHVEEPVHVEPPADPGKRCICGHDESEHRDRATWCTECSCSYLEPISVLWQDLSPERLRAERTGGVV